MTQFFFKYCLKPDSPPKPTENQHPNLIPQPEGPALGSLAKELQSVNQPPPVHPVMNQSDPSNPAPEGPAPGLQTDVQPPPVQPHLTQSEPVYEVVLQLHEEHTYMCMYI